jgi:hypothetical protein
VRATGRSTGDRFGLDARRISCIFRRLNKRDRDGKMTKVSKLLLGAGLLALAACGGQGDDSAGENVQEAYENQAENLEAMADTTGNEAAADTLENQADQLRETGEAKEEAIDEADVNAAATNGM